jgi:hypothetical protein
MDSGSPPEPSLYAPIGRLLVSDDGRQVLCHLCGMWFRQLTAGHLRTHGLDAKTYREQMGLRRSNPLMAPELSRRRAEVMRTAMRRDPRLREAHQLVDAVGFPRRRVATEEERIARRAAGQAEGARRRAAAEQRREARARELGYASLHDLLLDRYVREGRGIRPLARELGTSQASVKRELAAAGIPLHRSGAPPQRKAPADEAAGATTGYSEETE